MLTYIRLLASLDWERLPSLTHSSQRQSKTTPTTRKDTQSKLTRLLRSRSQRLSSRRSSSRVCHFRDVNLHLPFINNYVVRLTVIDTPGFGDYVNNRDSWMPIIEFLDDQHESYMLQEQQPRRVDKIDLRVHACLYFIRPTGHTLKPLDIEVMKRLSSRVNLIPVVAKADTLSPADLARFKQRVGMQA
jgi:septin family protein